MQAPLFPNIKRSSLLYRAIVLFCFLGLLNANVAFSDDCPNVNASKDDSRIPPEIATIAEVSKDSIGEMTKVGEVNPVISLAVNIILSGLSVLGDEHDRKCELHAILQHIDAAAEKIVSHEDQGKREERLAEMYAVVQDVRDIIKSDMLPVPLFTQGERDHFFANALSQSRKVMYELVDENGSRTATLFERFYSENDPEGKVQWKGFIQDRPEHPGGFAFDWRLGVPELMQLIPLRLSILFLKTKDPSFSAYADELEHYRQTLKQLSEDMVAGIKCGVKKAKFGGGGIHAGSVSLKDLDLVGPVCADINTGYAVEAIFWPGGQTTEAILQQIALLEDQLKHAIRQ